MQGKRIFFLPKSSTSFCSTTSFVRSSSVSVLIWRLEEEVEEEEKERGELEEEGMEEEAVGNTEDILEDFGVIDEATIKEGDDWIAANGVGRKEESATDAAANDDSTVEIVQLSRLFRSREFDSDNESVVLVVVKESTKESSDDEDLEEEMEDGEEEEGALYTGEAAVGM